MYNTDGTVSSRALTSANALADFSYINARGGDPNGALLARCLTGWVTSIAMVPGDGGLYFNAI